MDLKERETPLVFISYSHQDAKILKRLRVHLKPLEQVGLIEAWDDTRIKAGDDWKAEVETALVSAKAAILLISADFLASDFIVRNELPPLLEAARSRGTLILPLILNHSSFLQNESLSRFQAFNPPGNPLVGMEPAKREKIFLQVYERIRQHFPTPSLPASQEELPPSPPLETPPESAPMQPPPVARPPVSSPPLAPLPMLSGLKESPSDPVQTQPPARKIDWAFNLTFLLLGTVLIGSIGIVAVISAAKMSTVEPGKSLAVAFPMPEGLDATLVDLWEKATEGDTQSQYRLAEGLKSRGIGPGSTIVKWYREAAEDGHPQAQMALARLYAGAAPDLVKPNDSLSLHWARKAARQGVAEAQVEIAKKLEAGIELPRDSVKALDWYLKAAGSGNAFACNRVGEYHYYGYVGEKQLQESAKWYRKAAELGNADGQHNLGYQLYSGEGVTQDYSEAVKWFRKAAEGGSPDAQYNLGLAYQHGTGVKASPEQAKKWFKKAAAQGFAEAEEKLATLPP